MSNLLRAGWVQVKKQAPPAVAAGLMYGGIHQILSVLNFLLTDYVTQFINLIIEQGFRDRTPLARYGGIPWLFNVKIVAIGVIVTVVGTFVGLWVHARTQRQSSV
jgi:hypothetical protein